MKNKIKVYIGRDGVWGDSWAVHLGMRQADEAPWAIAQPILFKYPEKSDEALVREPAFCLGTDDAQAFMDELWNCGFRPTEGTGSAGAMAAVQAHLKDMQRLVFKEKK